MSVEFVFSAKLSDEWIERVVPFVYINKQTLKEGEVLRPISFQKYEKLWIFSPQVPMLREDSKQIGITICPAWVCFYDGEKQNNKKGFDWRAFIPYRVYNSKHNSSSGTALTLEEAMKDSESWIMSCLEIK